MPTISDDPTTPPVLNVHELKAGYTASSPVVQGISLDVRSGEVVTLLGPSGCGKTTTLRCVAGLHKVAGGEIRIDGQLVGAESTHVRPEKRSVNMVFQSYALWPHMTVFENVAYGLKAQRLPKQEIIARTNEMLELVGLGGYGERSATNLSGGQQQRVVLARGLVTQPKLLLLDEPLSNLDTELRLRMRTEINTLRHRLGLSMLYVTHDRTEALAISDRVVVMRDGVIQQTGSPEELYATPVNRFVAQALGPVNVLPATIESAGGPTFARVDDIDGVASMRVAGVVGERTVGVGEKVDLLIRPESLTLRPRSEGDGGLVATVELIEFLGNHTEVRCVSGPHRYVVSLTHRPVGIGPGDTVTVALDGEHDAPSWQIRSAE